MKQNFRPDLEGISAYEQGTPIEEIKRKYGLDNIIKMASNENPLGPSQYAVEAIHNNLNLASEFPGDGAQLKDAIAEKLFADPDEIILTNGSDESISLIIHAFSKPGDEIIISAPPYAYYYLGARSIRRETIQVPLKDFTTDLGAMARAITDKTRAIFITNPHNPTGTIVMRTEVERFLQDIPNDVIVIFDEAYHEYVSTDDFPNTLVYIREGRNVVVLRTFSKIYALAGLRIGYSIAKRKIIQRMEQFRLPFNTNVFAQVAALAALNDEEHLRRSIALNEAGKRYLYREFKEMSLEYVPTQANFILVNMGMDGRGIYEKLCEKGIIIRPMDIYGLPNYLRVTIGKPQENRRFIAAIKAVIGG